MKLTNDDENMQKHIISIPDSLTTLRSRQFQFTRVLFLVSVPPTSITATWPPFQNPTLPQLVCEWGAKSEVRSWRDDTLDSAAIAKYDKVTFLWCNDYHEYPDEFFLFLKKVLLPVRVLNPRTHIFNDPMIVLWNADKHYLIDLAMAGFPLPKTKFLDVESNSRRLLYLTIAEWVGPLVLKPSISGSARNCHLIKNPKSLNHRDISFLDGLFEHGTHGDLVLQDYEPGIVSGEWSLMFVNGKHTHTVLKVPQQGEFRINGEFGGRAKEVARSNVPQTAVEVAQSVLAYLHTRFGSLDTESSKALNYARIDGVMHGDEFVLMEVELIEPHLWLEKRQGALAMEELKKIFVHMIE